MQTLVEIRPGCRIDCRTMEEEVLYSYSLCIIHVSRGDASYSYRLPLRLCTLCVFIISISSSSPYPLELERKLGHSRLRIQYITRARWKTTKWTATWFLWCSGRHSGSHFEAQREGCENEAKAGCMLHAKAMILLQPNCQSRNDFNIQLRATPAISALSYHLSQSMMYGSCRVIGFCLCSDTYHDTVEYLVLHITLAAGSTQHHEFALVQHTMDSPPWHPSIIQHSCGPRSCAYAASKDYNLKDVVEFSERVR